MTRGFPSTYIQAISACVLRPAADLSEGDVWVRGDGERVDVVRPPHHALDGSIWIIGEVVRDGRCVSCPHTPRWWGLALRGRTPAAVEGDGPLRCSRRGAATCTVTRTAGRNGPAPASHWFEESSWLVITSRKRATSGTQQGHHHWRDGFGNGRADTPPRRFARVRQPSVSGCTDRCAGKADSDGAIR